METAAPPSLLATVNCYHQYLRELLLLQQEALLERDIGLALGFWQLHRQMLQLHIHLEEELLLPALEKAVANPNWSADIYRAEHTKVLDLGEKLGQSLMAYSETGLQRRAAITLLDKQRSYKNLLEHHEEREEKALLPELDEVLDASQLIRVNNVCAESWQVLYQKQLPLVSRLASQLDNYP
jgi:hemerythrin-like domain-containing protein